MKKYSFNPYLPSYEYIPDGEPHIVGDRVYVYGSHDLFDGISFCMGDYVCYSAPLGDLSDWRYEGVIFKREQDPSAKGPRFLLGLAAPDMVQGPDGRFYLYYFMGGTKKISVAVCDTPAGKYEFYGDVHYDDGTAIGLKGEPFQFDPGVFMDDDGRLYLYSGFALRNNPLLLMGSKPTDYGPMVFELDPKDMLTVKKGPAYIGVGSFKDGNKKGYKGHLFLEASSMRKFDGKYYYIYSSMESHELCYAVSDKPTEGFTFGGTLVSNGDIGLADITSVKRAMNNTGNTHGSLIKLNGRYYVFYHRQTNRKQSSRQACVEEIRFENGRFYQAQMTSKGFTIGAIKGTGSFPAYIACNLYGKDGTRFLSMIKHPKKNTPFLTQDGGDRENGPDQYIDNFCDGAVAGFKFFDLRDTKSIRVFIKASEPLDGEIVVYGGKNVASPLLSDAYVKMDRSKIIARISVRCAKKGKDDNFGGDFAISGLSEKEALYITYKGKGRFKFLSFDLY